jgi:hypothetical protein
MKLAIVGSVDLNPEQYENAEFLIRTSLYWLAPAIVVTGGAAGVDTIAMDQAKATDTYLDVRWPDVPKWEQWGQRGYKARNIEIAERCDELIAIRSLQSKTYGSGWTADYAESIGKKVRRYYV